MPVVFNAATAANVSILRSTNEMFQTTQKRVATGKNVFSAADDAARFRMSESLLGRSRQLDSLNNNISLTIQTLKNTDDTLQSMIRDVEKAQELARKAQAEGAASQRSITSNANINTSSNIGNIAVGDIFSITSDNGRNFTYTVTSTNTTWQQVGDALNAANIGVQVEYLPTGAANSFNLKFASTNGLDFTFDGKTSQTFMSPLANNSWTASTGGQTTMSATTNAQNLFANAATSGVATAPTANETGWIVSFGGRTMGTKDVTSSTAVAANSVLVFTDDEGQVRTLNYTAATTVDQVIADIKALNCGVSATLTNQATAATGTRFDLRSTRGKPLSINLALGDFASTGALGLSTGIFQDAPLSTNNALRLDYGRQYNSLLSNVLTKAQNNPVQIGRNLLAGQGVGVILEEFANATSLTLWGANVNQAFLTTTQAGTTWTGDANIQTSAGQINVALSNLRDLQSKHATFASYIKDRYDSNRNYAESMKSSGDDLVSADVAEESARLTALQTQQQFAVQAFSAGSQNAQSLLRLLG